MINRHGDQIGQPFILPSFRNQFGQAQFTIAHGARGMDVSATIRELAGDERTRQAEQAFLRDARYQKTQGWLCRLLLKIELVRNFDTYDDRHLEAFLEEIVDMGYVKQMLVVVDVEPSLEGPTETDIRFEEIVTQFDE